MLDPSIVLAYRFAPEPRAAFVDLDLVRVCQAVTTDEGANVPAGTRGTVVAVYASGAAYEVEFADGIATVDAADLVPA